MSTESLLAERLRPASVRHRLVFTRPDWEGELDYLFIDEAGQVPLANAIAMARSATNLVLLGDQMPLEQPVQGTHPGDAGMSVLQYALKDVAASRPDAPVYYPVIPPSKGLFLDTSRRMHPRVCRFISESIYQGRLEWHPDRERQRVGLGSWTELGSVDRFQGQEAPVCVLPLCSSTGEYGSRGLARIIHEG